MSGRISIRRHIRLLLVLLALLGAQAILAAGDEQPSYFEEARANASDKQKERWKKMAESPRGLFFSGRYDEAIKQLKTSKKPEDLALLADILVETGRDAKALKLLTTAIEVMGKSPVLLAARGDAYAVSGRYREAQADYRAATADMAAIPQPGQMRAKLALAQLHDLLCRREAKFEEVNWFFDYYMQFEKDENLSAEDALHIGYGAVLGEDFDNGFRVVVMAERKDRTYLPALIALGDIFSTKYQYGDAEGQYRDALELNPRSVAGHLGIAGLSAFKRDFEQAGRHAELALAVNPRAVEAHLVLAMLDYIDEQYPDALKRIDEALKINPNHPDALRFKAALHKLTDDEKGFENARKRWLELCVMLPGAEENTEQQALSRLQAELSNILGSAHLVEEALAWARKAVETDPENAAAHARLAVSLMRNGLDDEAKPVLDDAFELDRYNVWLFNLRKLQERDVLYKRLQTERFQVKVFEKDAPILQPEMERLFDEQLAHCEKLFGFSVPKEVIHLAMMKSHSDFSARVTGLPHLDASGATFGPFVALVSPAEFKRRGRFINWRSVALHEIAHVVTLMASDYRVPRWLTEGMSVYAEGWITHEWDVPFKTMVEAGPLPDFRTWNTEFHRPKYIWQVPAAYHAAGKTVGWLVEEHGPEVLNRLLVLYGQGKTTTEALEEATGKDIETLNRWLHAKLRAYARTIQCPILEDPARREELEAQLKETPDDLALRLKLLRIYRMSDPEAVRTHAGPIEQALRAEAAKALDATRSRMVARGLYAIGRIHLLETRKDEAVDCFTLATRTDAGFAPPHQFLGLLAEKDEDLAAAEAFFRKAIAASPRMVFDEEEGNPYVKLAALLHKAERHKELASVLESYWQVRRDDPEALRRLAQTYEKLEQPDMAMHAYRRLFAVDPYEAEDRQRLAALLEAAGENEEAARQRAIIEAYAGAGNEDEAPDEAAKPPETTGGTDDTSETAPPAPQPDPDDTSEIDPKLRDILDDL